jgi:5,10-methylenetetrahydrofolate reductase
MLLDVLEMARAEGRMGVVCDVSPPRTSGPLDFEPMRRLRADALCCAYLPGRAVRLDSATMAWMLQHELGVEAAYALATRDMNRLALSAHMLSAAAMGVSNVVVLHGDDFSTRDRRRVRAVRDTTPTQTIATATQLAAGRDFRGRELGARVSLCVGAAFNSNRDLPAEAALAFRKAQAGAQFFLTEPICDSAYPEQVDAAYRAASGAHLDLPVCWGVPVLARESVALSAVPQPWQEALAAGCSGSELAIELLRQLWDRGVRNAYVIPPIFAGGERDYGAAATVIDALRAR